MEKILFVGIGGFIGSILRYLVSDYIQIWTKSIGFPYGTLAVNLIGCLFIGLFSQLTDTRGFFTVELRSFLFIGLLGAFTTFSTFSSETMYLFYGGEKSLGFINIVANVFCALIAIWLGRSIVILIWR